MGKYDSSLTRVKPVFDQLIERDSLGLSWLESIFNNAEFGHPNQKEIKLKKPIESYYWGKNERAIPAPESLLVWLISNLSSVAHKKPNGTSATSIKRQKLYEGDEQTILEALELLMKSKIKSSKKWYILEGASQPDVYIETSDSIFIVEGKRTESSTTQKTVWMRNRDQILRHVDAAWDFRGDRNIYAILIVDGKPSQIPDKWIKASKSIHSLDIVKKSLPHRDPKTQLEIASCYRGVITWQRVCSLCNLEHNELPDEVIYGV